MRADAGVSRIPQPLHILTAVTRRENLPAIHDTIQRARSPHWTIRWHIKHDLDHAAIGGQAIKNQLLDEVDDGWVWVLDDDTFVHPDALRKVEPHEGGATVVSQLRTDGRVLLAAPENVCMGSIDIGQAFLSRELIGEERIPESYEGDGFFLEALLRDREGVRYLPDVLSFHNGLSNSTQGTE